MKEEDILARQSRPQRYSTFVPRNRDWRYATGVFRHDDFQDAPKDKSTWDTMDYEYAACGDAKDGSGYGSGIDEIMTPLGTLSSKTSKQATDSPCTKTEIRVAKKFESRLKGGWASVTRSTVGSLEVDHYETPSYQAASLIVRLRFTGANLPEFQRILSEAATRPLRSTPIPSPPSALLTPISITSRTQILDPIGPIHKYPLFQRTWIDETRPFNIAAIRSTLRKPSETATDLGGKYNWYDSAVPVSAIFPPGVPLSAKEINAYYPHHVRWKDVMLRLVHNDYRGADIIGMQAFFRGPPAHTITISQMNTYQRDTVKSVLPTFKTVGYKGKSDRNLYTDSLARGKYIEDACKSFTLPTFNDLLHGLQHLPTGLNARGLTQCLRWYLCNRDSFTPPLDLNVLHTQALIQALRQPLKGYGPQNLDRNALQEWRETGSFEAVKVQYEEKEETGDETSGIFGNKKRTQLHMNLDDESVTLDLTLPLRHVLTFPFLALHSVVGEALNMGIGKAEARRMERKGETELAMQTVGTEGLVNDTATAPKASIPLTTFAQSQTVDSNATEEQTNKPTPYRIPKRPRPAAQEEAEEYPPTLPKKPTLVPHTQPNSSTRPPTGPRADSRPSSMVSGSYTYTSRSPLTPNPAYLSQNRKAPAPSSFPSMQERGRDIYGRVLHQRDQDRNRNRDRDYSQASFVPRREIPSAYQSGRRYDRDQDRGGEYDRRGEYRRREDEGRDRERYGYRAEYIHKYAEGRDGYGCRYEDRR